MQTLTTQIKDSGTRLRDSGSALFSTTFQATNAFVDAGVSATREAYEALVAALTTASNDLVAETKTAGDEAREALIAELEAWKVFAEGRLDQLQLPSEATVPDATQITAQLRTAPRTAEEQVLKAVKKLLVDVEGRVTTRLDSIDTPEAVVLPAAKKAKPATKKKAAAKSVSAPIKGYDAMTAKELAQKLSSLTLAKVEAVAEYERANKNRTTVLRAAQSRLN